MLDCCNDAKGVFSIQRFFLRVVFLVAFFFLPEVDSLGLTVDDGLFPNDGANGLFEPNE